MTQRVPFHVLREAHQHARDTVADNAHDVFTVRDYWPSCLEMAVSDWQQKHFTSRGFADAQPERKRRVLR